MFCPKCGNQNPDGALFCTVCGEKLAAEAVAAVQEAAAPVVEAVQEAAAPVVEAAAPAVEAVQEAAAPVVEAAAPAQAAAPVQEVPVQQPVYQQPVQEPVYQQPVYQQPVYQQPMQQPVFQQPYYQQPVQEQPKKKSKAPLIITLIVILLLVGGAVAAYFLGVFDSLFKKEEELPMSSKEQKTFKELVQTLDEAIIDTNGRDYAKGIPDFAQEYVYDVYGARSAQDCVDTLFEATDEKGKTSISFCGDDTKVTKEVINSAKKIKGKDLDSLTDAFEENFDESVDIANAYLVENTSCFKGEEGSAEFVDNYLFVEIDEEWYIIPIGDNKKDFGLK